MKSKTDSSPQASPHTGEPEFSPGFLRWLITITIGTLVMVFLIEHGTLRLSSGAMQFRIFPQPWIIAAGITIHEGSQEFQGKGGATSYQTEEFMMLVDLLLLFVVGPTLLLFGWRASQKHKDEEQRLLRPSNIAFVLGGILLVPIVFPAVPGAVTRSLVYRSMKSAQAISEEKDRMMYEMTLIAFDARQFRARPYAMGGGGGSYFGYNISPDKATTPHGSYLTVEVGEEMIVFKGTSARYPASNIVLVLDEDGNFKWTFGGEFH